ALVPLMTIGYAVLSGFPAFTAAVDRLQQFMFRNMLPELGTTVLNYLNTYTAAAGKLTAYGLARLGSSAILVVFTIERAFNTLFRVRGQRPVFARVLVFWAGLTLTPLLLAASLTLSANLQAGLARVGLSGFSLPGGPLATLLLTLLEAG